MNHLTASELFELVDNRLDEERKRRLEAHLAFCDRCRRAVELERSVRHVVRSSPIIKAPEGLSALIMANLSIGANDSLILRLLGKLGSFVAMAMVLAVIGFVIVQVSDVKEKSGVLSSSFAQIVAPLTESYTKGVQTFIYQTSAITQAIDSKSGARFWNTIFIVLLTFGVLAAADKMFGKRLTKLRS
jgi:predicted anti-sigma-YlaC factor YlaD